jgi:hypothetical protein
MGRLESFKQIRVTRRRYILSAFIFIMLMIPGICISDYSVNSILMNEKRIEIVGIKNVNNTYLELNLLKKKYYINIKYLQRDYEKVKNRIFEMINYK